LLKLKYLKKENYLVLGTCVHVEGTKLTKNNDSCKRLGRKITIYSKKNNQKKKKIAKSKA